jgi:excisionase family DNA binding protein
VRNIDRTQMPQTKSKSVSPQLISVAGAAIYLSVSPRTVRRLIAKGDIPIVRVGGSLRIAVAMLNAYIALHTESEPWQTAVMKVTPSH